VSAVARPNPWLIAADIFDPPKHPYVADPVGYALDVLQFFPWSKQRAILESVRDNDRTAVRSCHGIGKSAAAGVAVLWFLATHTDSRVITTAPTYTQVVKILWAGIRAQVRRAHARQQALDLPTPLHAELTITEEWYALGISTNESERLQGHHSSTGHMLLVVDEASGVAEDIFTAAEGFLTSEHAKVLLIGNPTRVGGQFHRAFASERALWNQIHISVYDSPSYTGEEVPAEVARAMPHAGWAEQKRKQWGEKSTIYQVRVKGDFSDAGEDNVIGLAAIEAAQAREIEPEGKSVISCDVGRFGDDETVIVHRHGQRVRILEHYVGNDTIHTAGRVKHHYDAIGSKPRVVVDDVGVGGGVTDALRAQGVPVEPFNGAAKAHRPLMFPNRRSEIWFEVAEQLEDLDLDGDEQLAADLCAPTYTYDLKLRRVVEKKEDTKKRIGRSPDRGDAVLMSLAAPASMRLSIPQGQVPRDRQSVRQGVETGQTLLQRRLEARMGQR